MRKWWRKRWAKKFGKHAAAFDYQRYMKELASGERVTFDVAFGDAVLFLAQQAAKRGQLPPDVVEKMEATSKRRAEPPTDVGRIEVTNPEAFLSYRDLFQYRAGLGWDVRRNWPPDQTPDDPPPPSGIEDPPPERRPEF